MINELNERKNKIQFELDENQKNPEKIARSKGQNLQNLENTKKRNEEMEQRKDLLKDSISVLNDREREILYSRRLNDDPTTLEDLSKKYKISRERVRQIENKAFEKLQKQMLLLAKSKNLLPAN